MNKHTDAIDAIALLTGLAVLIAVAILAVAHSRNTQPTAADLARTAENLRQSYAADYLSHTAHDSRCPDWHLNSAAVAHIVGQEPHK